MEDTRDAVRLGQHGAIDHAETYAYAEPLKSADHHVWRGQEDEGVQVAQENSTQDHIAQFAARSTYQRRVCVLDKDAYGSQGQYNAKAGDTDGNDGEDGIPTNPLKSAKASIKGYNA